MLIRGRACHLHRTAGEHWTDEERLAEKTVTNSEYQEPGLLASLFAPVLWEASTETPLLIE